MGKRVDAITVGKSVKRMQMKTWLLLLGFSYSAADLSEYRLYNDLMRKYSPLERPVDNFTDTLTVTFGMSLQQIVDVVCCKEIKC